MPERTKKEDIAERLREILGVDVKFEKLSSEDLAKLYEVLTKVFSLAEIGIRSMASRVRGIAEREFLNKPLREILKEGGLFGLFKREGGLFGFNIIPSIFERLEKGGILKSEAKAEEKPLPKTEST